MSQHHIVKDNLHVIFGYDRPLKGYHITVTDTDRDEVLITNLAMEDTHPNNPEVFFIELERIGFQLGELFTQRLYDDKTSEDNPITYWEQSEGKLIEKNEPNSGH